MTLSRQYEKELRELANDMSTPFWAKLLITDCLGRDAIDVDAVLGKIAQLFSVRAGAILREDMESAGIEFKYPAEHIKTF